MGDAVERYLELGLALGRHVDGLVDSYVGPPELAERVAGEPLPAPEQLVAEAEALAAEIDVVDGLEPQRRGWLGDQTRALAAYARVLAGEGLGYEEEVERCYGVRAERGSEAEYVAAHERLDELLPGSGGLRDRYESWREANRVPSELAAELLADVALVLRERTRALVELPDGESAAVEAVRDEPWWAFNYFLGERRSRVVVNVDITTTAAELVDLAAHEVYPGHHTERTVKEQRLVVERGWLEESIQLVPTPAAVVSEGIAEIGRGLVVDDELGERLEALFAARGIATDLAHGFSVGDVRESLRPVGIDAALMLHVDGASEDEARSYLERWALMSAPRAANSVRFLTDPTWRAYSITYSAGRDLCHAYVAEDADRFRRLLTEQVRIGDLLAAV